MTIIYISLGACVGFCKAENKWKGHRPGKESEWNRGYSRSPYRWR